MDISQPPTLPPGPGETDDSDWSSSSCESTSISSGGSDDEEDIVGDSESFSKSLLNFRSANFNPGLALFMDKDDPNLKLPDAEAPVYLNLPLYSKAVSDPSKAPVTELSLKKVELKTVGTVEGSVGSSGEKVVARDGGGDSTTGGEEAGENVKTSKVEPGPGVPQGFPIPGRRFLPHQLPVFRPRTEAPTVKKIMETAEGPLSGIKKAMELQRRVKVWTRNDCGIRGFMTGFIEAFDKHWNLALRDVDEQFQRKRKIKYPTEPSPLEEVAKIAPTGDTGSCRRRSERIKTMPETKRRSRSRGSKAKSESLTEQYNNTILGNSEDLVAICRKGLSVLSLQHGSPTKSKSRSHSRNSVERKSASNASSSNTPLHTKSTVKKKRLTIFKTPIQDANGFRVVAQTKKYEIVERHVGQLFLMGNDIVFIETGNG
jgi:small nuclear ribonucleoprotein (snRNP)-like protein